MFERQSTDESHESDDQRLARQRASMVREQLVPRGIHDRRVLEAMGEVPRHEFVPVACRHEAYQDWPLPIGFEQTISQPLTVAFMIQALHLQGEERVLDVGTGSGYSAAILSRLAREVHTVERIPELAERAERTLRNLGYDQVHVHVDDGTLGLPTHAPFDAIIVAAGAQRLPPPYVEQLAPRGRIVIPIGGRNTGQCLMRYSLFESELIEDNLGLFAFVPLLGKFGWRSSDSPPSDTE